MSACVCVGWFVCVVVCCFVCVFVFLCKGVCLVFVLLLFFPLFVCRCVSLACVFLLVSMLGRVFVLFVFLRVCGVLFVSLPVFWLFV